MRGWKGKTEGILSELQITTWNNKAPNGTLHAQPYEPMSLEPHLAMVGWDVLQNSSPEIFPCRPIEEGDARIMFYNKKNRRLPSLPWTRRSFPFRNLDESKSSPRKSVWHRGDPQIPRASKGVCGGGGGGLCWQGLLGIRREKEADRLGVQMERGPSQKLKI